MNNSRNQRTVNNRIVDTSAIPYMRQREVSYDAKGLRPGSIVNCYFDGKLVKSNQTVDVNGELSGTFNIPARIPTGTKIFEIYDGDQTTSCSTEYTASGVTQTRQSTITTVRNVTIRRAPRRRIVRPLRIRRSVWQDPIAQSFLVDSVGGAFVTSIDVYFRAKDPTLPVSLYLVEMENGLPTSNVIPFSYTTLYPTDVNANGADPDLGLTKFTFSDPIFLEDQNEYAFVLFSDSDKYEAWISTLGNTDVKTGVGIARQPYLGSMFKSQNSTTWTADQLSDIRFTIRKAQFDDVTVGQYNTVNKEAKKFNMVNVNIGDLVLPETDISYSYSAPGETPNESFINNENIHFVDTKDVNTSADFLAVRASLSTNNKNLSPVIDKERMGGVTVLNTLNPDLTHPDFPGWQNCGVLVYNGVNLINPAESLKVLLDANIPAGSGVKLYFKTQDFKPTYLSLDVGNANFGSTAYTDLVGKQVNVYEYTNAITPVTKRGELIVTGFDGSKIYYRAATDANIFTSSNMLFISDDDMIEGQVIKSGYSAGAVLGDFVRQTSGKVFVNITGNDTAPTISNPDWKEVSISAFDNTVGSTVDPEALKWRPLVQESTLPSGVDPTQSFVEYLFKPQIEPEAEFNSFTVKIELYIDPANAGNVPSVADLRAIAVY